MSMDPGRDSPRTGPPGGRRLLEAIREGVIGADHPLDGPYGPRRLVYADYTASGRALDFVERFILEEVLPYYANTHSEASATGRMTSKLREEARELIARCVGAGDDDVVIFCGSGATGAIDKLVTILGLRLPAELDQRFALAEKIPPRERPVVFVGPFEHHSNELAWRESIADTVVIDEDRYGRIDAAHLERELESYSGRPLKIGSFSAASNVTGILSDTHALTSRLHRHGALALWDFAAAAPYVKIEMNSDADAEGLADKDALFISPHKFVGGPGAPGLLVVKRALLKNRVPSVPGGGTVSYVSRDRHDFLEDPVRREEGGTPSIVGAVRAGLAFQLKQAVGEELIEQNESRFVRRAIERWSEHPKIEVLGDHSARRLAIVSFMIRCGERFLHHNLVVALLSDLFGIQARGGCSCAGPYGHRLLGIDSERSAAFERAILAGYEGIKPGWTRIGFNYFIGDEAFEFILRAVEFLASHGAELIDDYEFDLASGNWSHRAGTCGLARSLADLCYDGGEPTWPPRESPRASVPTYDQALVLAEEIAGARRERSRPAADSGLPGAVEPLRWFPLPGE